MNFAHLHVHTEYSLLDGSNKIKEYVNRVKELGMTAAAITDHGVMFGVIEFYRAARAAGINPVLGCEVYVAPGSRFDKEAVGRDEDRYYHLVLLAENNTGESLHSARALRERFRKICLEDFTTKDERQRFVMRRFSERGISFWNFRTMEFRNSRS